MLRFPITGEIVGCHQGLQTVFQMVSQVAATDSTVLLLGETGTGKELIANAIHHLSPRKDNRMVKLNCAALPSQLIESELFGHEKGSFTGAIERRIGKFESAINSTLFLDEVGELGIELQAKLLRSIQEKEIARVGGKNTISTDVRIIAASNRDLNKEANAGRFRQDLFYRLNVFPILLPPLRERKIDIPALTSYFIEQFSKKFGKPIRSISRSALKKLTEYHWPGNVRELENTIEKAVLLTEGDKITEVQVILRSADLPLVPAAQQYTSLEENERSYILSVLKKTNGRIRGDDGAAKILQVPPTTLHSKMKKLGIRKTGHQPDH